MDMKIYSPRIIEVDAVPMTTSLAIAEHFEKEHKNVIRDIRAEIERQEDGFFSSQHFLPFQHVDVRGKSQPIYRLTELGFSLIVMGFTGQKASKWKRAYAETFMGMREQIKKGLELEIVNKGYAIDYQQRIAASLKTDLTKSVQQIRELTMQNLELSNQNTDLTVQIGCYGFDQDVHENRMVVLQVLRQSRLDWLQLRETKTRYVIDPNRVSNAETVLRLTYALSKSQAAVLWLLLGMGEGVNSVTLSILSIYTLLAKTKVSQTSIQVAVHKLADAGFISWSQSGGSHTPRSYWVNVDKVVDCLREYEQKWLHTNKDGFVSGSPVAGLTDTDGMVGSPDAKEFLVPKKPIDHVAHKSLQKNTQFKPDSTGLGDIKPEQGGDGKAWKQ